MHPIRPSSSRQETASTSRASGFSTAIDGLGQNHDSASQDHGHVLSTAIAPGHPCVRKKVSFSHELCQYRSIPNRTEEDKSEDAPPPAVTMHNTQPLRFHRTTEGAAILKLDQKEERGFMAAQQLCWIRKNQAEQHIPGVSANRYMYTTAPQELLTLTHYPFAEWRQNYRLGNSTLYAQRVLNRSYCYSLDFLRTYIRENITLVEKHTRIANTMRSQRASGEPSTDAQDADTTTAAELTQLLQKAKERYSALYAYLKELDTQQQEREQSISRLLIVKEDFIATLLRESGTQKRDEEAQGEEEEETIHSDIVCEGSDTTPLKSILKNTAEPKDQSGSLVEEYTEAMETLTISVSPELLKANNKFCYWVSTFIKEHMSCINQQKERCSGAISETLMQDVKNTLQEKLKTASKQMAKLSDSYPSTWREDACTFFQKQAESLDTTTTDTLYKCLQKCHKSHYLFLNTLKKRHRRINKSANTHHKIETRLKAIRTAERDTIATAETLYRERITEQKNILASVLLTKERKTTIQETIDTLEQNIEGITDTKAEKKVKRQQIITECQALDKAIKALEKAIPSQTVSIKLKKRQHPEPRDTDSAEASTSSAGIHKKSKK